jgi:hypothetical protein
MKTLWYIKNNVGRLLVSFRIWKYYRILRHSIFPQIYEYSYLKNVSSRGKLLFDIIKPYIKPEDSFLDIMCGYSPLAGPVIETGHRIVGFDENSEAINHLNKYFSKGEWYKSSYKNVDFKDFSFFLLIGTPEEVCCLPSFKKFLLILLRHSNPRLFFLEVNKGQAKTPTKESPFIDQAYTGVCRSFNCVLTQLIAEGYTVLDIGEYNAQLDISSLRIYAILNRDMTLGSRKV